jgi:signal transduction histidine kinase
LSKPRSFSLLLRSGADITVIERPSWWTAQHALWVLAGLLAVFCASLSWVVVLRKQVQAQTKVIAQKIQREAALEERTRIARDLHDDLGASLTHIGFLSEVARKEKRDSPAVEEHLREISGSTQDAFHSLDQIVWVVNPVNDTLDNLVSYLCHFAGDFFRETPIRCRFDVPANVPDHALPTEFRNNLFFAVKEALNNVRKHAAASEVTLGIKINPVRGQTNGQTLCSICVEDNGCGFDLGNPCDRNGLKNMRERLQRIGGTFDLESNPGSGTKISFTVPI